MLECTVLCKSLQSHLISLYFYRQLGNIIENVQIYMEIQYMR